MRKASDQDPLSTKIFCLLLARYLSKTPTETTGERKEEEKKKNKTKKVIKLKLRIATNPFLLSLNF